MSKIRNTRITNKGGFRHTCYVATQQHKIEKTATILVYVGPTCSHIMDISRSENTILLLLDDFRPDCVALMIKVIWRFPHLKLTSVILYWTVALVVKDQVLARASVFTGIRLTVIYVFTLQGWCDPCVSESR